MSVTVELTISENIDMEKIYIPDEESFQLWTDSACLSEEDVVASMQVIGRDEMQRLNKAYRDIDAPTNVLSFPMQLPDEVDIKMLGDLAFCVDVIEEEAKTLDKGLNAHWAHMVVHGMLHLQGYDHIEEAEADVMEAMEVDILNRLGFEDPYVQH